MSCTIMLCQNNCPIRFNGKACENNEELIGYVDIGYDLGKNLEDRFCHEVELYEGDGPEGSEEDVYCKTEMMPDLISDAIEYCYDLQASDNTSTNEKEVLSNVIKLLEEAMDTKNSSITIG